MNRPVRRNLYSLPRMTKREAASCVAWEVIAAGVWATIIIGWMLCK